MQKYAQKVAKALKTNARACVVILSLIVMGDIIGNIVSCLISEDNLTEISAVISRFYESEHNIETDKWTLFFESLKEYTFSFVFILVCSFSVWLIPLAFVRAVYEGFCTGIASGLMVRLFGAKAFLHVGLWLMMKNLIYIPLLIFITVYSVKSAIDKHKRKNISDKNVLRIVVCEMLWVLLASTMCGVFESFVATPLILKLI
ncbi:MAG: hypothetical protein E7415_05570 [Ruminococcaceae bacterium]|nr:hypothetical protein [Oscillospiraceae bacterium]